MTLTLCCPVCLLPLNQAQPEQWHCKACDLSADYREGIYQLQTARAREHRARVDDFISPSSEQQWIALIRRLHALKNDRQWFNQVVAEGNNAVKLLINLPANAKVLNLGSNLGSLSHCLASSCEQVYVLDDDLYTLKLAKARNAIFYKQQNLVWICHKLTARLPFADNSLDLVLISHRLIDLFRGGQDAHHSLLNDIYRVLSPQGQLLLIENNKYSVKALSKSLARSKSSFAGQLLPTRLQLGLGIKPQAYNLIEYQKMLNQAGFNISYRNSLDDESGLLRKIQPIAAKYSVSGGPYKNIKQTLKQHALTQSSFCLTAYKNTAPGLAIIEQIIDAIKHTLSLNLDLVTLVNLQGIDITGKNKGILKLHSQTQDYIVKLPFDDAGRLGEENNAHCLTRLAREKRLDLCYPQYLTRGDISGNCYFTESFCSGVALQQAIKIYGRDHFAQPIFDAWLKLARYRSNQPIDTIDPVYFAQLVEQPAKKIKLLSPLHQELDHILVYLRNNLLGQVMQLGLFHGDFSVSNTLTQEGKVTALIDWETCRFDGPCLIDLLSIYTSIERMFVPKKDIVDNLMDLLTGRWSNQREAHFIAQACQVLALSPQQQQALIIVSWFHGMTQQLDTDLIYENDIIDKRINRYLVTISRYLARQNQLA